MCTLEYYTSPPFVALPGTSADSNPNVSVTRTFAALVPNTCCAGWGEGQRSASPKENNTPIVTPGIHCSDPFMLF